MTGSGDSTPENYFGAQVAEKYDESVADMFDPAVGDPNVDFLAELAGDGAALELGIGTGRIAVPLAQRGVQVHGIDLSEEMVAKLRAKSGAEAIGVTIGDFGTTRVEGTFSVAYLVFNGIMNLTTQDEQVACFENVAAHLEPGGRFVIEVGVPGLRILPPGEKFTVFDFSEGHIGVDEYDVANQGLVSHHFWPVGGKFESASAPFRYAWPAELDLMARLAGMSLRDRWSGWERQPFTSESTKHISVWEKRGSLA
jgi:SAM-dependent methyltransferase